MADEPSDDMKDLWRNQSTESPRISVERFRRKARKLQKEARRGVYTMYAVALGVFGISLSPPSTVQQPVQRVGMGILAVWALILGLRAHRKLRPTASAEDATPSSSVRFYRSQLERHRDHATHVFWMLAPLFAGIAVFIWPAIVAIAEQPRNAVKASPFFVLLAIWAVLFFFTRRHKLRKLHRKLDELAAFEKEIQS